MNHPTEDAVGLIASYITENQAENLYDIPRAHGFATDRAKIVDLTTTELLVLSSDAPATAPIPWAAPLTRHEDVRSPLFEMQDAARWS